MLDMRGEHIDVVEPLAPLVIYHLEYLLRNTGRQTVGALPIAQMLDDLLGLDGMPTVPANGNAKALVPSKVLIGKRSGGAVGHRGWGDIYISVVREYIRATDQRSNRGKPVDGAENQTG
jgi:hypothetical protein